MELRPGYKQTEVGLIPEEWEVVPFSEFLEFRNGVNADKHAYGKGIPFINVLEVITKPHLQVADIPGRVLLSKSTVDSFAVRRGDLVFNRTSETQEEVGLSSVYVDDAPVVFGGFVIRGRPIYDAVDPVYSGYAFRAPAVRAQIVARGQGAIRANIGQSDLRQVFAPLPALPEQRAIAGTLGDVDALLDALTKLITKKRDLKQAARQQLLTGQTRLPGFSGQWDVVSLSDIADKTIPWSIAGGPFGSNLKASDYTPEGVRIIQLQNIGDGRFHEEYAIYTSEAKADELLSNNIYPGEIILSKMGDPVARACFVPTEDRRYLMASDGIRLSVDVRRFDKRFVHDFINSPHFRDQAVAASTGSTRQRIGLVELKQLPFVAPSLFEQTAIATVLSDMDAEITVLEQRVAKTRALKQGMTQELLTGRTRLV